MRSLKYRYWKSVIDLRRCMDGKRLQGKIHLPHDFIPEEPPLHPNCRCSIQWLEARTAGTATKIGLRGADWWLKTFRRLPGYYITEAEATQLGWIPILANLAIVAPGKMLTKGVTKIGTSGSPMYLDEYGTRLTSITLSVTGAENEYSTPTTD